MWRQLNDSNSIDQTKHVSTTLFVMCAKSKVLDSQQPTVNKFGHNVKFSELMRLQLSMF